MQGLNEEKLFQEKLNSRAVYGLLQKQLTLWVPTLGSNPNSGKMGSKKIKKLVLKSRYFGEMGQILFIFKFQFIFAQSTRN